MNTGDNKRTYILLGVLILCVVAWFLTRPSSDVAPTETVASSGTDVGASALTLLAQVQAINFDFSILKKPEFVELINRTEPLPNLPVGRTNPFAPNQN